MEHLRGRYGESRRGARVQCRGRLGLRWVEPSQLPDPRQPRPGKALPSQRLSVANEQCKAAEQSKRNGQRHAPEGMQHNEIIQVHVAGHCPSIIRLPCIVHWLDANNLMMTRPQGGEGALWAGR